MPTFAETISDRLDKFDAAEIDKAKVAIGEMVCNTVEGRLLYELCKAVDLGREYLGVLTEVYMLGRIDCKLSEIAEIRNGKNRPPA